MTPKVNTHGLWAASARPAPALGPLTTTLSADVVVVGGGYTGLSAALYLAEQKASVVLLEAHQIGHGGSGRNVGLVNAGLWLPPDEAVAALPSPYGERLVDQLGRGPDLVFDLIARHEIACEAVRKGTLHCAVGADGLKDLQAREQQWVRRGAPVQLLGSAEAKARIGGGRFSGALLDRRAGTIQPLAYARGLAAAALRAGARLYANAPVLTRDADGRNWRIKTPQGVVTAPTVLLATNAYSEGPFTGLQKELVRLPYFNLATAPLPIDLRREILPGGEGCWDTRTILSSFRLDASGRLILGSVGALRGLGNGIHRAWGKRAVAQLFPQFGDVRFEYAWYGHIGMTDDSVPRLHQPDDRVFAIGGYNGRGIAPGTTFGVDLARLSLGQMGIEDLALPASDLGSAGLRPAREAYYEAGANLAHLVAARL